MSKGYSKFYLSQPVTLKETMEKIGAVKKVGAHGDLDTQLTFEEARQKLGHRRPMVTEPGTHLTIPGTSAWSKGPPGYPEPAKAPEPIPAPARMEITPALTPRETIPAPMQIVTDPGTTEHGRQEPRHRRRSASQRIPQCVADAATLCGVRDWTCRVEQRAETTSRGRSYSHDWWCFERERKE